MISNTNTAKRCPCEKLGVFGVVVLCFAGLLAGLLLLLVGMNTFIHNPMVLRPLFGLTAFGILACMFGRRS